MKKFAKFMFTLIGIGTVVGGAFVYLKEKGYITVTSGREDEDYDDVKTKVMNIKAVVDQASTIQKVPCHNDSLCENWILQDNERMYLIDWEYAGMNDGMWDLADVSIEASLTPDQEEILLAAYFNRIPFPEERKRFFANKIYLDFLWTLWGKARVPFDGEPMEVYAAERYARLKENLTYFTKCQKRK